MSVIEVNFSKLTPDEILKNAVGELDEVIVIGTDADGFLYARSNLTPDACLWLTEIFKRDMLAGELG